MSYNHEKNVAERMSDLIANISVRHKLPPLVHVLYKDSETGEKYGIFVKIRYLGRIADVSTDDRIGVLKEGLTPIDVADMLLERYPGVPLLCNEEVIDEFPREDISSLDENRYRLLRQKGILEIYIPYKAEKIPADRLPPGVSVLKFKK